MNHGVDSGTNSAGLIAGGQQGLITSSVVIQPNPELKGLIASKRLRLKVAYKTSHGHTDPAEPCNPLRL
ncbi:hypothetical protein pipiens_012352 [Culex pipiens pipiens]|uniref:Uncharacterized protein n=1 Tax=Culex pipiens pipiens TaxID=38569 RepID=A0ABD1D390_CULPP